MELAQARAQHAILEAGEGLVADVLVDGHTASAGRAPTSIREPSTASHSPLERPGHLLERLGRVLAVAVKEDDDVETLLDGQPVTRLLGPAVAERAAMADHGQGHIGGDLLVPEPDQVLESWLASSHTKICVTRGRKDSGTRSSTLASVDAALYATTRIPILGASESAGVPGDSPDRLRTCCIAIASEDTGKPL